MIAHAGPFFIFYSGVWYTDTSETAVPSCKSEASEAGIGMMDMLF